MRFFPKSQALTVSTKKDPLSEIALREGVFFCFGENNGKYHSFFRTFIICHSPQKSSFAQKVYSHSSLGISCIFLAKRVV